MRSRGARRRPKSPLVPRDRRSATSPEERRRRLGASAMSGEFQGPVYLGANHCLILRSDAQHRVSKGGPESFARSARAGAPFEAPSGRLRARGCEANPNATLSTVPHSIQARTFTQSAFAGQGDTQGVGIIPQALLLFVGGISAPNFVNAPPVCGHRNHRLDRPPLQICGALMA